MSRPRTRMIAMYGKGGIGKSTVSSNLSAVFAQQGLKVLHVGCDPKHDSTLTLLDGAPVKTVIQKLSSEIRSVDDIVMPGVLGMSCIECGGPEPGVGCGGRGVSRMFEVLDDLRLIEEGEFDVAVFDVLGDVVCGGFAAPLRQGRAELVYIVVSDSVMALFAANNIARAMKRFASNGIALGGLIVNQQDQTTPMAGLQKFAEALGTRIVGVIPRDPMIRRAEVLKRPVVELAPDSAIAGVFHELARTVLADSVQAHAIPTPFDEAAFDAFIERTFGGE
jgi:nitrogenase iron protein NifH